MPRTAPPQVRTALVERAAQMLARREPVTLRALVAGTGVSTMAVYTHFEGMPGLWRAVRQEGFERLAGRLAAVAETADPVRDLVALGAAYTENAFAHPHLYRAMFDDGFDLEDPAVAAGTFQTLIRQAARARDLGRFRPDSEPSDVATRYWASGHGLTMLVLTGVLTREALLTQSPAIAQALFVAAGDEPERCAASVRAGWAVADPPRS